VYSASYSFTQDDVGQPLSITSGTGFNTGTFTITAIQLGGGGQPTGNAILNSSAGLTGSTGGHGALGVGGTPGHVLTTATGGAFDATDIGRTVQITGGTGFNLISQPITAVTSNGGAVGATLWGTPGASLGTGIESLGSYTFNDLVLGGYAGVVSTPSHPFTQLDVGQVLQITGGTGFTPGSYTITQLQVSAGGGPTGAAILNAAAGTPNSTGGTGVMGSNQVKATTGTFLDGYFFAATNNKKIVNFSSLDVDAGGLGWNPLDYFIKHAYPDNVAALFADHEELYVFGDLESTQVFRDTGNADTPFMPDPGAIMHIGCQAPYSVARLGNGVAWIGVDERRGARRAYHAVGYNPIPVSTPAVEAQWAQYSTVKDAVAYTYADQGHELWVINFPSGNATWVYDATTQWWHQWGNWNNPGWQRHRVWVHCVVALDGITEKHYGGDFATAQIYVMSRTYKTDDGWPIHRRRRSPHNTNENMRRFYSRFEIDCDVSGLQRVFWNRLGNGRDRIWQLDTAQSSETGGVSLTLGFSDDRTQSFQTMFTQNLDPSVDVQLANAYLNWVDATWH
jgi:hypothetical protein